MVRLRYIKLSREEYRDDCVTIQEQLKAKGYIVSLADISLAWENYSADMCAGWLYVDKNSADIILRYLSIGGEDDEE